MADPDMSEWLARFFSPAPEDDRETSIQVAWQELRDAGRVSKVTVHTYRCAKCGQSKPLVVVIRLGENTIAYVRDYKFSPGMNAAHSVPEARERNTLDGEGHWPSHAYDVDQLARGGPEGGFWVACRHLHTKLRAVDVLAITDGIRPGHPGAPTIL